MKKWGCWASRPCPHPWETDIVDMACGYAGRISDGRCAGCHRSRVESPLDQLIKIYADQSEDGRK